MTCRQYNVQFTILSTSSYDRRGGVLGAQLEFKDFRTPSAMCIQIGTYFQFDVIKEI